MTDKQKDEIEACADCFSAAYYAGGLSRQLPPFPGPMCEVHREATQNRNPSAPIVRYSGEHEEHNRLPPE